MPDEESAASSRDKRLVVVLGMHRSGTSAVARALRILGVSLGERMLSRNEWNPSGYWEDLDCFLLSVGMLRALSASWHSLAPLPADFVTRLRDRGFLLRAATLLREKLSAVPAFGFKDPRVAILLPFWKEVFSQTGADVSYVLVVRSPVSVADSLSRRHHFDLRKSVNLWLMYCVAMMEGTADAHGRVLVDYDRLMEDPVREVGRMAAALSLPVDGGELNAYRTEFLDGKLRHAAGDVDDLTLNELTATTAGPLYRALLAAATDQLTLEAPALLRQLQKSRQQLDESRHTTSVATLDVAPT